jgi:hypothetical protein
MSEIMYLLIRPDEGGNPVRFLNRDGLRELLTDPIGSYGVRHFLDLDGLPDGDPSYWQDGDALLLKVEGLVPTPVTTQYELP